MGISPFFTTQRLHNYKKEQHEAPWSGVREFHDLLILLVKYHLFKEKWAEPFADYRVKGLVLCLRAS